MNQANHPEIIQALGKIAACRNEVQGMATFLETISLWRPGTALKKECGEVLDIIDDNERRFERKLMIAVIGPGGSGKSTLANALAGKRFCRMHSCAACHSQKPLSGKAKS